MSSKLLSFTIIAVFLSVCLQNCNTPNSEGNKKESALNSETATTDSKQSEQQQSNSETVSTDVQNSKIAEEEKEVNGQEAKSSIEQDIQFIRDKFSIISNAKNYKTDAYAFECGGETKLERKYNETNELAYLKETSCGQHGCLTTEHYFWNGALIFIFAQNAYWAGNTDYQMEYRTYFKNGKMIRCLEKEVSSINNKPKVEKLIKKTANNEVDCKADKSTKDLEILKSLNQETGKKYYCE